VEAEFAAYPLAEPLEAWQRHTPAVKVAEGLAGSSLAGFQFLIVQEVL